MSVELALATSIAPKAALLVGLAGVMALRIRKYRRVISYDPAQDHEFPFAECGATRGDAECTSGRIRLPQIPHDSTTVFLELVLKSAPGCRYFTPMIVIEAPGFRQEHHFERGAQGRRFVNLSGLASTLAQGPCTITLHQSWARVATGGCAVWSLSDPLGEDERLLVIAPHPDDAEISAFSLYTRHAARTMIVTVTAGERGHLRADLALEGMAEGCLKGELRTYDSIVVGLWGGVPPERSVNLGYFDSRLEDMRQNPQKPVESASGVKDPNTFRRLNVRPMPALEAATWDSLVEDMRALIRSFKPTTVVCPHPQIDWHRDHIYSTLAMLEAIEGMEDAPTKLAMYVNHHPTTEAYPFGPSGQPVDMPALFGETRVVSKPLWVPQSKRAQLRKAYAMNMMHDLRPAPEHLLRAKPLHAMAGALKNWLLGSAEYDISYFRRAVRSGELFFVVDAEGIRTLRCQLLASLVGELEKPEPARQVDVGRDAAAS